MLRKYMGIASIILGCIGTIISGLNLDNSHIWLIVLVIALFEGVLGVMLIEEVV